MHGMNIKEENPTENFQMRIYEVTNENQMIIELQQVEFNQEEAFNELLDDLDLFLMLKGQRLEIFINENVSAFIRRCKDAIGVKFYDETDLDIINSKNRLRQMIEIIEGKLK